MDKDIISEMRESVANISELEKAVGDNPDLRLAALRMKQVEEFLEALAELAVSSEGQDSDPAKQRLDQLRRDLSGSI